MSMDGLQRPLRGGCSCGRNTWIIDIPQQATERAQVLFHTDSRHSKSVHLVNPLPGAPRNGSPCMRGPVHQAEALKLIVGREGVPLATPLAAMIRVPLSWHRSSTHPLFPDEKYSAIRRVFETSSSHPSKRYFCGFCGTPLSYWTEHPHTEADYIHLTMASLYGEDLRDLEDLGLIPDHEETEQQPAVPTTVTVVGRETRGVPWFDNMIEGSRLGNLRRSQVVNHSSRDGGNIRVEWEIVEWTDADDGNDLVSETEDVDMTTGNLGNGKRKLGEREDADAAVGSMH